MPLDNKIFFSINTDKINASYMLSCKLTDLLLQYDIYNKNLVIFCIGTDRSTGDCLGPLVGYKLSKLSLSKNITILGTLNNPVHAKNLDENIVYIKESIQNPFVLAIDASLGKSENIGNINLLLGPVYPGAGVNKKLQPIGDISITGIVNTSGFMEYIVLQNTRLSVVMKMAEVITTSIYTSLKQIYNYKVAID
ncbi:spore protease YyaC [Thermobrachium celere]|uniref:spore protease YyaC n=1 Tax=Thermobrachium celere TaxID=53422 RepID=UPI001943F128|nr:spore protease YyaC [Thermobrachium celere]GFR35101.1 spore protease YyaC [Thermobrachium celere]